MAAGRKTATGASTGVGVPAGAAGPDIPQRVARWFEHIEVLAGDIGFRLPTSAGEAKALDYCAESLAKLGYEPKRDDFRSSGSVFRPHLAAAGLFILAFALYPLALPVTGYVALVITLFALFSEVMEVTLRPHPLQAALPKRPGQNVYAVAQPRAAQGGAAGDGAGSAAPSVAAGAAGAAGGVRDLVLIGHVDTQRTPIIFSTPTWFAAYRLYSTVAFVSFVIQAVLYAGGSFSGWSWAWAASAFPAAMAFLLAALTVQADLTPSTHGANDNATAAGLVLTLAEDLAREPLERTRVWLLCSGCEEALHEGAKTFFARHKAEMNRPRAVAFEMLGCAGPAWLLSEGFVLPLRSSPELQSLAGRVAREHPTLGARPGKVAGGVTEMSDAILAGVPAITFIGLTPQNAAPYWHLPTDTVDKMDAAPGGALERNYRFVRAFLRALDGQDPAALQAAGTTAANG